MTTRVQIVAESQIFMRMQAGYEVCGSLLNPSQSALRPAMTGSMFDKLFEHRILGLALNWLKSEYLVLC
jgi:hypothetical protein